MRRTLAFGALLTGLCLALAVVTLSLSGCSTVGRALNIVNPTYSLRAVQPHLQMTLPLQASSLDFDVTLGVDNPNSVALNLVRLDFGLLVNGNRLIDSVSADRIRIPARGMGDVHLRARVGYQQIPALWQQVVSLIQGQRAEYGVQGDAYFDTPLGELRFPVNVAVTR